MDHVYRSKLAGLFQILAVLIISLSPALSRDDGRYGQADPKIKSWIKGLKNQKQAPCCDTADGFPPEAVADMGANQYRVKINGEWYDVPEYAVIEPNRLGYPVVWYVFENGQPQIVCFLPGVAG